MSLFSRRSLRTQLIVWNSLALVVLLVALGLVIRLTVSNFLLESVDRDLDMETRPFMHPGPPHRFGDHSHEFGDNGPPHDHPGPPRDNNPFHPRRYDSQGHSLEPEQHLVPWDVPALVQAGHGFQVYTTRLDNGEMLRVITRPNPPHGQVDEVIQAAYPLSEVDRVLAGLDRALLTLVPVALLVAAVAGALLTDRVLRRVRHLSYMAGRITAKDFSERLPVSGDDEFSQLATTFNLLLGRLETTFQRQERLTGQLRRFTADASHELKTPLTIIQGNTSLALGTRPSETEYRQYLSEISQASGTMSRLVQDLLLLARSDEGLLGRDPIELLVEELLHRAASQIAPRSPVPIQVQMEDSSLTVMGNEDELLRLLSNLLENAMRFTLPSGHIMLRARRCGSHIEIQVADTGAGIAPEHLEHLGERFYRVDASRSRPDGGSGLGLSICRSIAEAHGGTLSFASAPGIGTTVTLTLPVV